MKERKILVVEDDPMLRELTRRQLAKLGFDSLLVSTGEEALEAYSPDISLIFMDIGLPGIDGINATMLIREKELQEHLARIPIVALTGHGDRERAILVGMDDYLRKPALIGDLKGKLDHWLPLPPAA